MTAAKRPATPPRLSVLLASEAPVGVVFRRGPSKFVRVILWDRKRDKFKSGQWFKGRIYAAESDLSPDGHHMIYFAMGGVKWAIPETGGTWTAISQVPSLKALTLWGQGGTTRGGGGQFTSNKSYWLNLTFDSFRIRDGSGLRRVEYRPALSRRERAGWVQKQTPAGYMHEKALPKGWTLRETERHRYELEQPEDEIKLSFPTWEWAEWDRSRLVWAEDGLLRAAKLGAHKLGTIRTLYDFNAMNLPPRSAGASRK